MLQFLASPLGTRNVEEDDGVLQGGGEWLVERNLFSPNPSIDPMTYYEPGTGNPAVSTSDYYHQNGLWKIRPYDLDTMGSDGATIKAREGFRYVWMIWGDHPAQINYQDGASLYAAYSNDPQVLPSPATMRLLYRLEDSITVVDEHGYNQVSFLAYHFPFLVYNPDSAGDKFWIYAEAQSSSSSRQHELALITTPDFLDSTLVGPVIAPTNFDGWCALGNVERRGTGDWIARSLMDRDGGQVTGAAIGIFSPQYGVYTSTDGVEWTEKLTDPVPSTVPGPGPYIDVAGQKYFIGKESGTDATYLVLVPVNSNFGVSGLVILRTVFDGDEPKVKIFRRSPRDEDTIRISDAFGPDTGFGTTAYPDPNYFQGVDGYEEDGIISLYISRGYHTSGAVYTLNAGPYTGTPHYFSVTGTVSGTTLTVTATDGTGTIAIDQQLVAAYTIPGGVGVGLSSQPRITAFGTGSGGTGTYTISTAQTIPASTTFWLCATGGLWQQFFDQYYYITNATAAAAAAPLGVRASCDSGVVTVVWNDCLPHQTYRVYKGSSAGTQATLVGNVTGTSTTDSPTADQRWWYKVVTLNSGVEAGNRVVSTWVSSNTAFVNAHATRVAIDGGDTTKIDFAFLSQADDLLTDNDWHRYLMHWADAAFGVKESAGFIAKVYDIGTTRLPRGGDYIPTTSNTYPSTTSNTSYSATGLNSASPAFTNNASTARGYFGGGRFNNIRRKVEITLVAVYKKPGTAAFTPFGLSEFGGMNMTHAAGTPGNVSFTLYNGWGGGSTAYTSTMASSSATAAHVIGGVFDQSTVTIYSDGVAGSSTSATALANPTLANANVLRGFYQSTIADVPVLASGTRGAKKNRLTDAYTFGHSEAQASVGALCVFEVGEPDIYTAIRDLYASERL